MVGKVISIESAAARLYISFLRRSPVLLDSASKQYWIEDNIPQSNILRAVITAYDEMFILGRFPQGSRERNLHSYLSKITMVLYCSLDGDNIKIVESYVRGQVLQDNDEVGLNRS